jgi:hypothetical protein
MRQLNAQIALLEVHTQRLIAVMRTVGREGNVAVGLRADLYSILLDLVLLKSCREQLEALAVLRVAA